MSILCAQCGHENDLDATECSKCGASLNYDYTPVFTRMSEIDRLRKKTGTGGLGLYGAPSSVYLLIEGYTDLRVEIGQETTLGRSGSATQSSPDVDLTPYQATDKGVSRLHAAIRSHGNIMTLTDLNSTNGTILNGETLTPGKPRIIKSNDEIQLGGLVMRIQFDK